jgi:hypothetical protein
MEDRVPQITKAIETATEEVFKKYQDIFCTTEIKDVFRNSVATNLMLGCRSCLVNVDHIAIKFVKAIIGVINKWI